MKDARALAALIRERGLGAFDPWLEGGREGPPQGLAESLGRDRPQSKRRSRGFGAQAPWRATSAA